jgi:hypothetical protein
MTFDNLDALLTAMTFDGGHNITNVTDGKGKKLPFTSREDDDAHRPASAPAVPGGSVVFNIAWDYNIHDAQDAAGARTGYEHFPKDGNDIYDHRPVAPPARRLHRRERLAPQAVSSARGEFTLEFGDYLVRLTAPEDHHRRRLRRPPESARRC